MKHIWWKASLAIVIPVASVAPIIASCSNYSEIEITDASLVIDASKASASFTATIKEQPLDDVALVSVINTDGDHLVSMFKDGEDPYSHQNSLVLPVKDRQVHINLCFDDFVGEDTTSTFNLEIDYKNRNNRTVSSFYKNMTLSTSYNRPEGIEQVHIVDINDIHGSAPGYGDEDYPSTSPKNPGVIRIMDKVSDILINNPGSVFLSAGDNNSGEAFSSATHAESMYPLLKAMGIQYSAVGNHAFEWGYDDLTTEKFDKLGRTDSTLGNYLITSNILQHPYYQDHDWMFNPRDPEYVKDKAEADYLIWKNQFVTWADPYKLISLNGHLVCLVGLTTTNALTDGNQAIVKNTAIIDYAPAIYYATRYCYDMVGADWYNSIDTFVMLTHVESKQDDTNSGAYLIGKDAVIYDPLYETDPTYTEHTNVNEKLSLVISGHSHADVVGEITNDISGNEVKIGQANNAGRAFIDSTFSFDNSKPIGQRWVDVKVKEEKLKPYWGPNIKPDSNPSDWKPEEKAEATHYANLELNDIISNPRNELVKRVVEEYQHQSEDVVQPQLSAKIAESVTGHSYKALYAQGKELGHDYIMPDDVIEQAGAWNCAASIVGFDILHYDDIKSPSSVTYPAINFMAIDSITGEISENSDVTLNNIFNIQPHDNATRFGYLSVWQLAAIINYSLSGGVLDDQGHTYFDYSAKPHHSYENYPAGLTNYHRNLKNDYEAYDDQTQSVELCKAGTDTSDSCYVAGPLQWYGFKFRVDLVPEEQQKIYGRQYTLHYKKKFTADKYKDLKQDNFPDIQIYDPTNGSAFKTLYAPDQWVDVQDWLVDKQATTNGLIPCIVNDFMYTGGNDQNLMFSKYFEYNFDTYGKAYEPVLFSTLIRDLDIEYCNATYSGEWPQLDFDGSYYVKPYLITKPV